MADEAKCILTPTRFGRITVADGTGIPIGTLLKYSGDFTGEASSADNDKFAGITWVEKTASDGLTQLTVAKNGLWDIKASGTVSTGQMVNLSGANTVNAAASGDQEQGSLVGRASETATTSETIAVWVVAD